MKKILNTIVFGALCMAFAGCNLDMEPETSFTDSDYWQTETDLRGACNRFYQQTGNALGGFYHDYRSDELVAKSGPNSISDGSRSVPSTSGDWTDPYWRIFISNNILEKSERAQVTETVRDRYKAEARFFRAFHFFELVKKYGDVPMIMKAVNDTSDPILQMGRTPRETVIQQCYQDLQFAADHLPDIDHVDAWEHVSRSAALAMLVRVGLYEGTHKKYHQTPNGDWKAHLKIAIDAAETMITEKKHELYPDFQKLFVFDGEGRQNKENVFIKEYGPNGAGTTTHGNSRQLENAVNVPRQTLDMFLYTDGLPRAKSPLKVSPEVHYNDVFENRDPRFGMTFFQYNEEAFKGPFDPFYESHNGYKIKKGYIKSEDATNSKETLDKMIIRYAEVLISYAEALYEYNGSITDEQLDQTVNALRNRVEMPTLLTNAFVTANGLDMLEEIRRERFVEFIDENLHYDDIIRWKTAETLLPTYILGQKFVEGETKKQREDVAARLTANGGFYNGVKVYDEDDIYVIEEAANRRFNPQRDYLYPIPIYEISHSGGNVEQNPYWRE